MATTPDIKSEYHVDPVTGQRFLLIAASSLDANGNEVTDSSGNPVGSVLVPDGLGGLIAGERNPTSATNSYLVIHEECNYTVIDLSTATPVAVSSGAPAYFYGARVDTTLSAHAVTIDDGAAGATTTIGTIPASTVANTTIDFGNGKAAIRCETSLVVTPNAISTGVIIVFWRAM